MLGQIIPIIDIAKKNKILREKNCTVSNIEIPENIEEIDIKYLEDDYKATLDVKNRFEDKAKTIIAALTIAITLILNLSKIIDTVANKIPIPRFSLFPLYLTDEELEKLIGNIRDIIKPYRNNTPAVGRKLHSIGVIISPPKMD